MNPYLREEVRTFEKSSLAWMLERKSCCTFIDCGSLAARCFWKSALSVERVFPAITWPVRGQKLNRKTKPSKSTCSNVRKKVLFLPF